LCWNVYTQLTLHYICVYIEIFFSCWIVYVVILLVCPWMWTKIGFILPRIKLIIKFQNFCCVCNIIIYTKYIRGSHLSKNKFDSSLLLILSCYHYWCFQSVHVKGRFQKLSVQTLTLNNCIFYCNSLQSVNTNCTP